MDRQQSKKPAYSPQQTQRHKSNVRHSSGNGIYEAYNAGSRRFNKYTNIDLFLLSVLAGSFMGVATLLSLLLSTDIALNSVKYLLAGLGLTIGFLLVILTRSILATEANIFIPGNFFHVTMGRSILRLFRFWFITWIGNVIGAFLFAFIVYLCQEYPVTLRQDLTNLVTMKLAHAGTFTYRGMGELILSGMLANWIVALATFFALASRNLINQFAILFLVAVLIAATNFQYFPFNLGYFSLSSFFGKTASLGDIFFNNLIPVTLGNILGGGLLAAGPLLFLSKRR